jgi:hypothetical protein
MPAFSSGLRIFVQSFISRIRSPLKRRYDPRLAVDFFHHLNRRKSDVGRCTTNQASHHRALFRVMNRYVGNLLIFMALEPGRPLPILVCGISLLPVRHQGATHARQTNN